jgi:hypothetical protein
MIKLDYHAKIAVGKFKFGPTGNARNICITLKHAPEVQRVLGQVTFASVIQEVMKLA